MLGEYVDDDEVMTLLESLQGSLLEPGRLEDSPSTAIPD